ncbi:MAG: extracellular solute-binding protein [Chloroflexi bacterium]|nr:extracellular solute-binding protein [Chloroflexota bacterium]
MGGKSRLLMRGAAAIAVTAGLTVSSGFSLPRHASAAAKSTIYFTSLGDVNLVDLYRNTILPDFQKAYPQYTVHFTDILHGIGAPALIVNNITAATKSGAKSVKYDVWEDGPMTYSYPAGKSMKDYFMPLSVKDLPNASKVPQIVWAQGLGYGAAYRSSAVTLAYNSKLVPNPPKTFNDLIAWIKAHPGKFTYCKPDQGGTGDAFVSEAIRSVMDTSLLTKPYNKAAEAAWPKAWALLKSIEPDLYQNGFHPAGNIPVLNLLAKGTITMGTAWSDQGLNYLDKGLLPSYIKLTQITPPFAGGPSFISIPKMAQNPVGAKTLLNFILSVPEQAKIATAIEGFPAIDFKYVPASVVHHFGPLATGYGFWPVGQWDTDLVNGWKANVPSS